MNGWTSFASGFQARGDDNARRRVELAQAFNEFRATNPHATLVELQGMVDTMSGGRGYLRGGLPSAEVLSTIAGENEKSRRRAEQLAQLEDLQTRASMQGTLSQIAEQALLGSNGDLVAATEAMRGQLGGDWGDIDPASYISAPAWDRIVRQQTSQNYDIAKQWIVDTGGTASARDVAQHFGIPEAVASQIVLQAKKETEQADLDAAEARRDRMFARRREALDYVVGRLEIDPNQDPSAMLSHFFGVDPTEIDPRFLAEVQQESARIRQDAQKERERGIADRAFAARADVTSKIMADPTIASAIARGDSVVARQAIQAYLSALPDDIEAQFNPSAFESEIVDRLTSALSYEQDAKFGEMYTAQVQAAQDTVQAAPANSMAAVSNNLALVGGDAEQKAAIARAMMPLAQLYDMTNPEVFNAARDAAAAAIAQPDLGLDPAQAAAIALQTAGFPTMRDTQAIQMAQMGQAAELSAPSSFNDYMASFQQDLPALRSDFNQQQVKIRSMPLEQQGAAWAQLAANLQSQLQAIRRGVAQDRAMVTTWLRPGTGPYDQRRVDAEMARIEQSILGMVQLATTAAQQAGGGVNRQRQVGVNAQAAAQQARNTGLLETQAAQDIARQYGDVALGANDAGVPIP